MLKRQFIKGWVDSISSNIFSIPGINFISLCYHETLRTVLPSDHCHDRTINNTGLTGVVLLTCSVIDMSSL